MDDVLARSPFRGIKLPQVRANPDRYIRESVEEFRAHLECLPPDLAAVMETALGSACAAVSCSVWRPTTSPSCRRASSLSAASWCTCTAKAFYADAPKTPDSERTVPLPAFVLGVLAAHMAVHPPVEIALPFGDVEGGRNFREVVTVKLMFTATGTGKPTIGTTLDNRLAYWFNKAGLPKGSTPQCVEAPLPVGAARWGSAAEGHRRVHGTRVTGERW